MVFCRVLCLVVLSGGSISGINDTPLPDWCFNPAGDDCSWYKQCLVKQYPCQAASDSYAIGFGDAMCNEFGKRRAEFSTVGKTWIDETRACLQRMLVPVLTSHQSMTCPEIQTLAFDTHTSCYSDPQNGSTSFCELPFSDWFRVSWIIKKSFVQDTKETVNQALRILNICAINRFTGIFG